MKKVVFWLLPVIVLSSLSVFGQQTDPPPQMEQLKRLRERIDRSVQAEQERNSRDQGDTSAGNRTGPAPLPQPKPARMNVDVQGVLSQENVKNFEEAKARPLTKVADGDRLWLYVKFNGTLGDYVRTQHDPENPGQYRYVLFAEISPEGDISAKNQYSMLFTKEDLTLTEIKVNLAPGLPGRNASMPVYLATAAMTERGNWKNEFRLTNMPAVPRRLEENLISVPLSFDFSEGVSKYSVMEKMYYSMVIRGTDNTESMPIPGMFYSLPIKTQITDQLSKDNITPVRFYFASDNWDEMSSGGMTGMKRVRRIFAAFTYRSGDNCRYGVAEVEQNYMFMEMKYGPSNIKVEKDLPIPCDKLN